MVRARSLSVACTLMPPVSESETYGDRRMVALTVVIPLAVCTGPMRLIMTTESSPSAAVLPGVKEVPACTSRRFVPSRSRRRDRSAWLDDEMPSTATRAAMPMAMPVAVSAVRSLRDRSPTVPTLTASRGRRWLRKSGGATSVAVIRCSASRPRRARRAT